MGEKAKHHHREGKDDSALNYMQANKTRQGQREREKLKKKGRQKEERKKKKKKKKKKKRTKKQKKEKKKKKKKKEKEKKKKKMHIQIFIFHIKKLEKSFLNYLREDEEMRGRNIDLCRPSDYREEEDRNFGLSERPKRANLI